MYEPDAYAMSRAEDLALGEFLETTDALMSICLDREVRADGQPWFDTDAQHKDGSFNAAAPSAALFTAILIGDEKTAMQARYELRNRLLDAMQGRVEHHYEAVLREEAEAF